MSTLTTLRHCSAAAALSLLAVSAQAASMSLQDAFKTPGTGDFSHSVSFSLSERSELSLWLQGWSMKGVVPADGSVSGALAASDLKFLGLTLTGAGQSFNFSGHSSLGQAVIGSEQRTNPGSSRPWTAYLQTYELAPLALDAGNWTLTVYGEDKDDKKASGLDLRLQAQPAQQAVPEPGALLLASLSLLAAGLLGRRRQA